MKDHFASLYDTLMTEAPYSDWLAYAKQRLPANGRVLDLACGTGTLTIHLTEEGFHMSGLDVSAEMLAAAEDKARRSGKSIPFMQQDMRSFTGFEDLDGVTLFCDGLNYITEKENVRQVFDRVFESLKQGGVFLFDVHTPYKMEQVFAGQLFGEDRGDITYLWFCEAGEVPFSVEHLLTFFVERPDGTYDRMDEELYQRTLEPDEYENHLREAGFADVNITSDFGRAAVERKSERLFFRAVKK